MDLVLIGCSHCDKKMMAGSAWDDEYLCIPCYEKWQEKKNDSEVQDQVKYGTSAEEVRQNEIYKPS